MRIAIDCANGATATVAPRLFSEMGFEVSCIGVTPDGRNINLGCGSTAPEKLARLVVEGQHAMGVAFDGDGDRAIFVDGTGQIVDGDAVMLMCAKQMKAEGRLKGNAIVATVMSNIGLELALKEGGIGIVRCAVGDKYVMEEMIRRDLSLGGEQSGHIIFSEYLFTGDGLATALNVLRTMSAARRELRDLASELTTYPQVLLNLRVRQKVDLKTVPEIASVIASVESRLAGNGRLLVRYSGTEPSVAGDAGRSGSGDDPAVGPGDHRHRQTPSRVRAIARHGASVSQRQQSSDSPELARGRGSVRSRCGSRVRRRRRARHHRSSESRCASHHVH